MSATPLLLLAAGAVAAGPVLAALSATRALARREREAAAPGELERQARYRPRRAARAQSLTARLFPIDDLGLPRAQAVLAIAGGTAAWWLLLSLALGLPIAAAGSALLLGYFAPRQLAGIRADRRRAATETAIANSIAALRDFIRSGSSINRALQQLSESGPLLLRPEFRQLSSDIAAHGFETAIARSQERLAHPAWDSTALALAYSHRAGGTAISPVMDRLAASVQGRIGVRSEARARQTESVLTGRVLAVSPLALLAGPRLRQPPPARGVHEPAWADRDRRDPRHGAARLPLDDAHRRPARGPPRAAPAGRRHRADRGRRGGADAARPGPVNTLIAAALLSGLGFGLLAHALVLAARRPHAGELLDALGTEAARARAARRAPRAATEPLIRSSPLLNGLVQPPLLALGELLAARPVSCRRGSNPGLR